MIMKLSAGVLIEDVFLFFTICQNFYLAEQGKREGIEIRIYKLLAFVINGCCGYLILFEQLFTFTLLIRVCQFSNRSELQW
jgi:hypothetical protein